jgi:hypothetical protein
MCFARAKSTLSEKMSELKNVRVNDSVNLLKNLGCTTSDKIHDSKDLLNLAPFSTGG